MLPFESIAKVLLLVHLVSAFSAGAVSFHALARLTAALRGKARHYPAVRLHARLLAMLYGLTYVLGAAIYPTFRIRVRMEYFDKQLPWATALFEIKEYAATAALLAAVGAALLAYTLDFRNPADRPYLPLFAGLIGFVLAVLLFNAGVGWYLTGLRSV
jgi:hypothetical protein